MAKKVEIEKEIPEEVVVNKEVHPDYMLTPEFVGYTTLEDQHNIYNFACRELENIGPEDGVVSILDVGAGRGDLKKYLNILYGDQIKYTGIDSNPLMIELSDHMNDANIILGDFMTYDFSFGTDLRVSFDIVYHIVNFLDYNPGIPKESIAYILQKSLLLADKAVIFVFQHDIAEFPDELAHFVKYLSTEKLRFNIDNLDNSNLYRIVIPK